MPENPKFPKIPIPQSKSFSFFLCCVENPHVIRCNPSFIFHISKHRHNLPSIYLCTVFLGMKGRKGWSKISIKIKRKFLFFFNFISSRNEKKEKNVFLLFLLAVHSCWSKDFVLYNFLAIYPSWGTIFSLLIYISFFFSYIFLESLSSKHNIIFNELLQEA